MLVKFKITRFPRTCKTFLVKCIILPPATKNRASAQIASITYKPYTAREYRSDESSIQLLKSRSAPACIIRTQLIKRARARTRSAQPRVLAAHPKSSSCDVHSRGRTLAFFGFAKRAWRLSRGCRRDHGSLWLFTRQ